MEKKSVFQTLSTISVKDKIERKGNLDYISWANAWATLKQNYPDAQRKVYESEHTGFNYFTDGRTAWVKVGIIVEGIEHIDYLPIMDFRNNAVNVDKVTATDVNKAIQRSTAKAIAMHGFGLSLWTGEDVPEMVSEGVNKFSNNTTAAPLTDAQDKIPLKKDSYNWDKVVEYVKSNKQLGWDKIKQQLERKYVILQTEVKELSKLTK